MTKEHSVILDLIRKVVKTSSETVVPDDVDWTKVIEVATDQGVLGICFDAIETLPVDQRPDIDNLMEWLGQVEYQKTEYQHKLDVATELASELHKKGLRITVLKGFAFSRYYKRPELRYSCDFDCYLSDWEKGNKIAERLGGAVDRTEQKHSHIQYKDVHIENHRECTGISADGFERHLSSMLFQQNEDKISGTELELPPLTFDALFCLYHAQHHFIVEEGIQLRHVIDWILLRRKLRIERLERDVDSEVKQYGLLKFTESLNGVADFIEGKKLLKNLSKSENLMLNDILKMRVSRGENLEVKCDRIVNRSWLGARLRVILSIYHNRWKYSLYSENSAWYEISQYLKRYLKRRISNCQPTV